MKKYLAQRSQRGNVMDRIMSNYHPSIHPSHGKFAFSFLETTPSSLVHHTIALFSWKSGAEGQQWPLNSRLDVVNRFGGCCLVAHR